MKTIFTPFKLAPADGEGGGTTTENNTTTTTTETAEQQAARLKAANEDAKAAKASLAAVQAELAELKRKGAEAAGDFKTVAEQRRVELEQEKAEKKKLLSAFGTRLINECVEREAAKLGCIDAEAVNALLDTKDIEVDEDLKVDSNTVKQKLEALRQKKPHLFKKPDPTVHDVNANGGTRVQTGQKKLEEMTSDELRALLKTMK